MKKAYLVSIISLFAAVTDANAQRFYAGARVGAAIWLSHGKSQYSYDIFNKRGNDKLVTFEKDIFVRYENRTKWAFELSGNHFAVDESKWRTTYDWVSPQQKSMRYGSTRSDAFYEVAINIQRSIKFSRRLSDKGLKNYVGVHIGYGMHDYRLSGIYVDLNTGQETPKSSRNKSATKSLGLTHNLSFPLSRHVEAGLRSQILLVDHGVQRPHPFDPLPFWYQCRMEAGLSYRF